MQQDFSTTWPIFLAIIPTLGAFIVGSTEVWSDFILTLLVLYYVYKWITVPWSYYESARCNKVSRELRRHELIGLIWIMISPAMAGYTLQYSRHILSNEEKYVSPFNITVFVLAASLKPLVHIMTLLRERTLYLQKEIQTVDSDVTVLHRKIRKLENELTVLREAFATKTDLGQVAQGITPSIQQLSKAIKRIEKSEHELRSWTEEKLSSIEKRLIEQDECSTDKSMMSAVMLLPIQLTFWAIQRLTILLPSLPDTPKSSGPYLIHSTKRK